MFDRKNIKYVLFVLIIINSCTAKDKALEKYYYENIKIHQDLKDSLIAFSKKYKTNVILQKTNNPNDKISFEIHFHDSAELIPIYFDSVFTRNDFKPERTKDFIIPKNIIENFKKTNYFAIASDSSHIFFANEWNTKLQIGTYSDSQHGILITKDSTTEDKKTLKIAPEVYVTDRGIL
jgi:hypothetical protein